MLTGFASRLHFHYEEKSKQTENPLAPLISTTTTLQDFQVMHLA
jgi:hypothetical protein